MRLDRHTVFVAAVSLLPLAAQATEDTPVKPNVVIILADDKY